MSNDVREDGCLKGDQAGGIIGFLITAPAPSTLPPPLDESTAHFIRILEEKRKTRGGKEGKFEEGSGAPCTNEGR